MDCPVLQHVPLCEPVVAERKYDWGGLVREAVKQTIIRAKRLRLKVKNWGVKALLAPPQFCRPWCELNVYVVAYVHGLHPSCLRRNGL